MLSFIYRLVCEFENEHGIRPNLLYLNRTHLKSLNEQLEACDQLDQLGKLLGMEIVLSQEVVHPHVAWTHTSWQREAV